MSHIFISYSRKDIDFAGKIVQALAENNLDTWIDWKSIPKGEDWEQEIYRGIEEADAFLFLISPDSVVSEMCNKEAAHAVQNGKRILPIVVRNAERRIVPDEISKRNWIFCRDGQDAFNKAIEEIQKTIHTDYEWLKYHTKLQVKALDWERYKDASRLLRGKELRDAEQQVVDIGSQKDPQPTSLQRQYILISQRNEIRVRRQITLGLSAGLVIMVVLSFIAWQQRNFAISSQETAQAASTQAIKERDQARSGELATIALSNIKDNLGLSLLLSVEAFRKANTLQTRSALLTTLVTYPSINQLFYSEWSGEFEFSPDSQMLAANTDANEITLWDVNTGRQIRRMHVDIWGSVGRLVFSADDKTLAVAGCVNSYPCEKAGIFLLDLATGNKVGLLPIEHDMPFPIFTLSPDGKFVFLSGCGVVDISGCHQGQIKMFDAATGQVVGGPWAVHLSEPFYLAFDAISNEIVSIGCSQKNEKNYCIQDEAVYLDFNTGKGIVKILPENGGDYKDKWLISPDNSIAVGYYKDWISFWDIPLEKEIDRYLLSFGPNESLRWQEASMSPNGKFLVIPEMQGILILDHSRPIRPAPTNEVILGENYFVRVVKVSPDGKKFAAQREREARLAPYQALESFILGNTSQPVLSYKLKEVGGDASALDPGISAFNPDGGSFATAVCLRYFVNKYSEYTCAQEGIALWDAKSWTLLHILSEPGDAGITDMTYSPDGKILAAGDARGQITFWDMDKRRLVHNVESGSGSLGILSLAFSPDGKILAAGREPGDEIVLDIWNVSRQMRARSIYARDIPLKDNYRITDVAFSLDGKLLAGAITEESQIVVWDTSNWSVSAILDNPAVSNLKFNPDGKTLAAAGWDGSITIWDLASFRPVGKPFTTLFGGAGSSGLAFNKDGTELIAGFENISIWDMSTRQMVGQHFGRPGSNIALSADGKNLVSGDYVWDLDPQSWVDHACQIAGRNFTRQEWMQYFPGEEYRSTCSQWPLEPESTSTPKPTFTPELTPTIDRSAITIVNINTASLEELESLPGVTPFLAQGIINYREQNGPFIRIEDILYVPGLGPSTFESIKDFITVGS